MNGLTLTGDCLDVTTETVNPPNGSSFQSTTIHLLIGVRTEAVRLGKDFPPADLPRKDDKGVTLGVFVTAYPTRGGAGYRLTATERVKAAGARIAAAS